MPSGFSRVFEATTEAIDKAVGWHRLPRPLGILTLLGIRDQLRKRNLHDTGPAAGNGGPAAPAFDSRYLTTRTVDGTYNDVDQPLMGSANTRFGRNVPLEDTFPEPMPQLLEPNPRHVSLELMTREEFIPATTLNLLAAAWIQFEVHDWVFHGKNEEVDPWEMQCADDDPWPERPMRIPRTHHDGSVHSEDGPPTWVNTETHWWDGSQIYGSSRDESMKLRSGEGGKLRMDERGLVPADAEGALDYAGVAATRWIGLLILHSLFIREHNAVCDHLHERYPELSDDDLFDRARLVIAALMAKIHTLEWTTAIIAHPTTVKALNTNWWGLVGERFDRRFGRPTKNEVIRGIIGSPTNHHGVPYSLTEEFVAVYRMHPLIPDEFTFRSARTGAVMQERTFPEVGALGVRQRLEELEMGDVFYSFGISHPGAITLHNFPRHLQRFERPDGVLFDLAATDILRVRERGVPRYNRFRELMHMKPATSFDQLTDNPEWADQIRQVYGGDLDRVDLMVGLFGEPKPRGFGFSDTAFRVFVLMASRRLESDRFFTRDYRPEVYTRAGLDWVDRNTMKTVLLRHFPELEPSLRGVENAFQPWAH